LREKFLSEPFVVGRPDCQLLEFDSVRVSIVQTTGFLNVLLLGDVSVAEGCSDIRKPPKYIVVVPLKQAVAKRRCYGWET
jgi:hypothetical protein